MLDQVHYLFELLPAAAVLISVGVAYGMLKTRSVTMEARLDELEKEALALDNSMQGRVGDIARQLSDHKQEVTDRLARIETKLDILVQNRLAGG
jgi:hypothetical protein